VMGAYLIGVVVIGMLGAMWARRSPDVTNK
jgi:hypothetical protein